MQPAQTSPATPETMSDPATRIEVLRVVPTGPALIAAHAAMFDEDIAAEDHQAFSAWFSASRDKAPTRPIDALEVPLPQVMDLITECPRDLVGQAWAHALRGCAHLTMEDTHRPFDQARIRNDHPHVVAWENYVDSLRAASPLLAPVADALDQQCPVGWFRLGSLTALRALIRDDGLVVAHLEAPEDRSVHVTDTGYGDAALCALVTWTEIDLLRGAAAMRTGPAARLSTRTEITTLLAALDSTIPTIGPDDHGVARGVEARR
ncbi:hypothetical protein [Nocardioides sp. Leaf285]|uniref:hypothetical protein n=1 Tax=Nocardioides sp. Leaf285 TaxID=1736322 RepID=UPI000703325C|nr:hypothetical protein [Nocardioides sp. Leaf285]KQP62892.1 hypothetical protein ASF47_17930 [Nocardioides sp. Leaf285]